MRTHRVIPLWPALATLALVLALATLAALSLARINQQQAGRLSQLEAQNRRLAAHSRDLARQIEDLQRDLVSTQAREPVPPAARQPAAPVRAAAEEQHVAPLRESLARANASIAELQVRVEALQADMEKGAEESKRLAAAESEVKERLASANRVLEAVQAELKTKADLLAQMEATADRLHQENRAASERVTRMIQVTRELEEISRRRETYLTSILRRFRDLTDQYRALATPGEGVAPSGAELARIQNAITGAEEDLRQLSSLNAQAARLQRRIAPK